MNLHRRLRATALAGAAAGLVAVVLAACGTQSLPAANGTSPAPGSSATRSPAAAGFVGYKWTVVAVTYHGKTSTVPSGDARSGTYLLFTPDGHFGANEPVNYHGGTYAVTSGGFTTHGIYQTLVGMSGPPLPEVEAISAFGDGTHASAKVTGNVLTVAIEGYTLTAHRDGRQANFPPPQPTSTVQSTSAG
jgi:hypothetical protein